MPATGEIIALVDYQEIAPGGDVTLVLHEASSPLSPVLSEAKGNVLVYYYGGEWPESNKFCSA